MDFPRGPATADEQVEAVLAYAHAHYDNGAWDLVVETMTKDEIKLAIVGVTTRWGAIERINKGLKPVAAYRKEIESTAF